MNENRTITDWIITVWFTGFYWHKKRRQLLFVVSLSDPSPQSSNFLVKDLIDIEEFTQEYSI